MSEQEIAGRCRSCKRDYDEQPAYSCSAPETHDNPEPARAPSQPCGCSWQQIATTGHTCKGVEW